MDNPAAFRNPRRFTASGISRLARMGFAEREAVIALLWLSRLRGFPDMPIFSLPPSRSSSFRPLAEELELLSAPAVAQLFRLQELQLLSVHDLEQLFHHIREFELAPVQAEDLPYLFARCCPLYTREGLPLYVERPNPDCIQ
jgi:uncharacterized protein Smg (DUF494 family)